MDDWGYTHFRKPPVMGTLRPKEIVVLSCSLRRSNVGNASKKTTISGWLIAPIKLLMTWEWIITGFTLLLLSSSLSSLFL